MDAKVEILARIGKISIERVVAKRDSVSASLRARHEIVEQFGEYAADYKARVRRVTSSGLPEAISAWTSEGEQVIIPNDLPLNWLPNSIAAFPDDGGPAAELERFTTVITGCAVAIAETGTFVLDAGFAQGRRAISLIPDHHICVVFEDQIVNSVPEAVDLLSESVGKGQPLTWISGPSATSDIELSRVEGVHGPRNLDILIVGRES